MPRYFLVQAAGPRFERGAVAAATALPTKRTSVPNSRGRARTDDTLHVTQLLYLLSYAALRSGTHRSRTRSSSRFDRAEARYFALSNRGGRIRTCDLSPRRPRTAAPLRRCK